MIKHKKSGASYASGEPALRFKKDSKNYSENEVKKTNPNKKSPLNYDDRKKLPKSERQIGEKIPAWLERRKAERALKAKNK